jgi:hypothetical protein
MGVIMANAEEIINNIETKSNDLIASLEVLRTLEDQKKVIEGEITKIKTKLDNEEISKFSYATMLEINKKNITDNTNYRKKTWDDIAGMVNEIGDLLNSLKDEYNKKTEIEGIAEIKEPAKKK